MMHLAPPLYMYEGVVVAPDYNDEKQFFYFPNRPHIANDDGHPAIRLLVYKSDLDELEPEQESVAGFLYFDTTLEWPEATLKKVAQKIMEDRNLDQLPRLSPLLYKSGSVRLIFLGKETPPPSPAGGTPGAATPPTEENAQPDRWVIKLETSGVPSLYADNRAVFSTVLTKEATQLLLDSFDGFIPAAVVYDLAFVGMQRAFNVRVTADWEQIYHFLDEKFSTDFLIFQSQVEEMVSELIDKKIIKIEASLEGVDEEAMESEFNAVRKELTELALDKFFKPVPFPDKQDPNQSIPDTIVDFARDLRTLGYPSVGFSRREVDMNEVRTITADYTVSRAVERKIAPQAHLSLFFEDFSLTRDQVVTVVNGEDDFWKTVDFTVNANADFEGDAIFGLNVDVAYGADSRPGASGEPVVTWNTLLNSTTPRFNKSSWFDPEDGQDYAYRYKAIFSPTAVPGPEPEVHSDWEWDSGNVLTITPTKLFQNRQLEFQLVKNFPADLYPQAQVQIRYEDLECNWTFSDSQLIDLTNPHVVFKIRARIGAPSLISYRYLFAHTSGPVQTEWETTDSDLVLVMDPRPNLFRVNILVAGDRSKINDLLLNLRYEDLVDGHVETGFIRMNKSNINDPHEWVFAPADPKRHRYSYSQTLIDTDGNFIEVGEVQEEKNTLTIGVIYAKKWEVRPELIGPPLAENGLEKIKLKLHYRDTANGVSFDKEELFPEPGKGEPWVLELKDPSMRSYTYEVIYVQQNGFERKVGPKSGFDTFPIISSVPPT